MSNQYLKLRRSAIPGKIPATESIDYGEIALNTYDGLAFIKKSGSNGEEVIAIGANSTGSLFGTASWAVTASYALATPYVANLATYQITTGSVTASVNISPDSIFLIKSAGKNLLNIDDTGSISLSGSITVNTTGSFNSLVSINNNDTEYFKLNEEGVLVLHQYTAVPTAVTGGMYFDIAGNLFIGV